MKESWMIFRDKETGKELCAYTIRSTFSGEREATAKQLAYENKIPVEQIEISIEAR